MAAIYLKHPTHGSKVACTDLEAKYDEGLGWERYDPEALPSFLMGTENAILKPVRGKTKE